MSVNLLWILTGSLLGNYGTVLPPIIVYDLALLGNGSIILNFVYTCICVYRFMMHLCMYSFHLWDLHDYLFSGVKIKKTDESSFDACTFIFLTNLKRIMVKLCLTS